MDESLRDDPRFAGADELGRRAGMDPVGCACAPDAHFLSERCKVCRGIAAAREARAARPGLSPGTLCWSTLHQGDARIYRVARTFDGPHGPQAEVEAVYHADLTPMPPRGGGQSRPTTRNVNFLVPLTVGEIDRRIDTLTALRSVIGGDGGGVH